MASPLRCGGFSTSFSVFWATLFRKLQVVLFTPPSFCLGVFLFCSPSSWDWGQRRIARVFLGSWPSTFLFFWFFGVFLQKHCFSPFPLSKGYFGSFLGVSLSFSLASFTSVCHTLSLSIYIYIYIYLSLSLSLLLLSCFFPSLLSCLYFYLPFFWLFFVVLFFAFVS